MQDPDVQPGHRNICTPLTHPPGYPGRFLADFDVSEFEAAANGKALFHPALAVMASDITHRLDQIEARLTAAHPKAARDGQLASMLNSIRDEAASLGDPESSLYTS